MKQMKRLLFFVAVLLCAACEKDSDADNGLPTWSESMPLEHIERYIASRPADELDAGAAMERLLSSVYEGQLRVKPTARAVSTSSACMKCCFERDGSCYMVYVSKVPSTGEETRVRFPIDDPVDRHAVGRWRFDARKQAIALYDVLGETLLAVCRIEYFLGDRMILSMTYEPGYDTDPASYYGYYFCWSSYAVGESRYLFGECSTMPRDEFKRRYELE